jgi:hypothetical protein
MSPPVAPHSFVTPAEAGGHLPLSGQTNPLEMDPRLRGDDEVKGGDLW